MRDRCVNCGSTDPFPRRRLIKLGLAVLAMIGLVAFGFYFNDRTKELKLAEEKARAVGERVYERGAEEAKGNE
jgi:hypothetical protein